MPRARLTGCSCRSPLAHFYIHHASSSVRELHPFTTITHLASKNGITPTHEDDFPIQFLFRKSSKAAAQVEEFSTPLTLWQRIFRGKKQRMQSTQWTGRLAGLADQYMPHHHASLSQTPNLESGHLPHTRGVDVALRLEGPYFSPADASRYDTVVCLVAGTGISGGIAIAAAFNASAQNATECGEKGDKVHLASRWRRCVIVWSVKETDDIELPFIQPMAEGLELRKFLTGPGRKRVDLSKELGEIAEGGGRTWIYISGPSNYINAGKVACQTVKSTADIVYYAASWDV